jgi:hypothetical protein
MAEALISDTEAVRQITTQLDAESWSPDTLEAIAEIVRLTGRKIRDCSESDDDT